MLEPFTAMCPLKGFDFCRAASEALRRRHPLLTPSDLLIDPGHSPSQLVLLAATFISGQLAFQLRKAGMCDEHFHPFQEDDIWDGLDWP
jgi:hypothetical protein